MKVPKILRDHITEEQWNGHTLNPSFNNIGPEGVKHLAKWPGHTLNLEGNNIGPEGAKHLSKWRGHTLNLSFNNIAVHNFL